jgi:alkaline phosphatase
MKRISAVFSSIALVVVLLTACSGGGGGGGGAATGGGNTVIAANSTIAVVRGAAPVSACPNGGIQVDAGIDDNGNSILDPSEVNSTQYVCNGETGGVFPIIHLQFILYSFILPYL